MPLLYRSLSTVCPDALPRAVLDKLRLRFYANARLNFVLTEELLGLLDLFQAHGIAAIPYKGPALAAAVYRNLALRQAGDLDILVQKGDAFRARRLLIARGYAQTWPQIPLTRAQEEAHLKAKYDYQFRHAETEIVVELHWSITPRYIAFPPDPERLWDNLESVGLANKSVLHFRPEDLLLILCAHGANHCWIQLSQICDVSELIRQQPGMDWQQAIGHARLLGSERMLLVGLILSHDLLGASLPTAMWRGIQADRGARSLAAHAARRFSFRDDRWLGPFEEPLFHLRVRERLRDKARYCFSMAAPSVKDWTFVSLPGFLSFLYYLIRPFRLGVEHGLKLLRLPVRET